MKVAFQSSTRIWLEIVGIMTGRPALADLQELWNFDGTAVSPVATTRMEGTPERQVRRISHFARHGVLRIGMGNGRHEPLSVGVFGICEDVRRLGELDAVVAQLCRFLQIGLGAGWWFD